jgi:hypothetical protein
VVTWLPAAFAAYWLAIFTLNLYLAARIAQASGRFGREWPDLPSIAYPVWYPMLVALAIICSFAAGLLGVAGRSIIGALLFAYLLAGLAVTHFIARQRATWLLWVVYACLLLFGPYAALALTTAGLLEPIFKLKRRFGVYPPST